MRIAKANRSYKLILVALGLLFVVTGCSSVMSSVTGDLAESLRSAVLNQNDPETVRQGGPAYLLMIDGLIADSPKNIALLLAGANLYSSYAGVFVDDPQRASLLAEKGRKYGWQALCQSDKRACGCWDSPYEEFEQVVNGMGKKQVPVLFSAGAAWATWIRANLDDWEAIADKARVDAMMRRVVALDENYEQGAAHLYLGVLASILPRSSGGKPEEGKMHYERVFALSDGKNLTAKVFIAEDYARLVFDRELHDRLCKEVIAADPEAPGLTLSNTIAQKKAEALLESSEDYFGD